MQQKFAAVPVGGWTVWGAAEMSCLPKEVLNIPCVFYFFFIFFIFWWTCFNRCSCLACEGFPGETILWDQVSVEGSWALRSQSLPVRSICTFPRCLMAITVVEKTTQITDRRRNRWFGVNVPHAPRPAEWGAILFLCLPALTRPGLDLGLSRTVLSSLLFFSLSRTQRIIHLGTTETELQVEVLHSLLWGWSTFMRYSLHARDSPIAHVCQKQQRLRKLAINHERKWGGKMRIIGQSSAKHTFSNDDWGVGKKRSFVMEITPGSSAELKDGRK